MAQAKYDIYINEKGEGSFRPWEEGLTSVEVFEWLRLNVTCWSVADVWITNSGIIPERGFTAESAWAWVTERCSVNS